ncbi:MAG: O-antigen ligase family protein, partial [Leptonema sp. (in: bacteria)]
ILLFNADTSKIAIPFAIGFTLIIFSVNTFFKNSLKVFKYTQNSVFIILVIVYIFVYFYLWDLAKKGNSSLINRFFYWYVLYEYFKQNPWHLIGGLGEYQWGFLYKYLTFDISQFSFINQVDIAFYFHMHAHNDPISFLMGGGIVFLFLYILILWIYLKNIFRLIKINGIFYIVFAIFLVMLLHGITEPFTFSPYTGFIFWFFLWIVVYFKNSENQKQNFVNKKKILDLQNLLNIKKIHKKTLEKIRLYSIIFSLGFLMVILLRYELKKNANLHYHFQLLPKMNLIYQFQKGEPKIEANQIDQKIQLLEVIQFISLDNETYSLLADYYLYRYFIYDGSGDLEKFQDSLCKGFYLNSNIFFYNRINWLAKYKKIPREEICPNLKNKIQNYDSYHIF